MYVVRKYDVFKQNLFKDYFVVIIIIIFFFFEFVIIILSFPKYLVIHIDMLLPFVDPCF